MNKNKKIISNMLIAVVTIGGLGSLININASAKNTNKVKTVKRTRVNLKGNYLYNNLKMRQRTHIKNKNNYIYSKQVYMNTKNHKGLFKYVINGKNKGWIASKNVYTIKKHKKAAKDKIYKPNADNVKKEFIKLLSPYLKQNNKEYKNPNDNTHYMADHDKNNYGGEYVVSSGTLVQSDKEMAKSLFNGLYNGTLKDYLNDPSEQYVIIDHINFDGNINVTNPSKTPLGIDARLYLTWYQNRSMDSPDSINN